MNGLIVWVDDDSLYPLAAAEKGGTQAMVPFKAKMLMIAVCNWLRMSTSYKHKRKHTHTHTQTHAHTRTHSVNPDKHNAGKIVRKLGNGFVLTANHTIYSREGLTTVHYQVCK